MAPQASALAVIKMADHIHRTVRPRKKDPTQITVSGEKEQWGSQLDANTSHSPLP